MLWSQKAEHSAAAAYKDAATQTIDSPPLPDIISISSDDDGDSDDESEDEHESEYDSEYDYELEFSNAEPELDFTDLTLDPYMSFDEFCNENYDEVEDADRWDELEEYWQTRFWEHPSMLYAWFESSYLPRCKHRLYEHYTPRELKCLVNNRGLADPFPKGVTLKYFYIRLLMQADKEWRFPFMDLPPESRLTIYREFLTFPVTKCRDQWKHSQVHPAILRTCKQINQEAKEILYHDNTFSVGCRILVTGDHTVRREMRIHNEVRSISCSQMIDVRCPKGFDDYPEFLRRTSNLQINMKYTVEGLLPRPRARERPLSLNHFLATLSSFLMERHKLKTLKIDFDGPEELGDWSYGMVLYPLRRLCNLTDVTFEGPIPPRMERRLGRELMQTKRTFNTLRYWKILHNEASAQIEWLDALRGDMDCAYG